MSVDKYIRDKRSFLERATGDGAIPHKVFPFAGNGDRFVTDGVAQTFGVRSLAADEIQRAHGEAMRQARAYGYDGADLFGDDGSRAVQLERWTHILARALVCPDDPSRLITAPKDCSPEEARKPRPDLIKSRFEADELELLHEIWDEFNAGRSVMSKGKLGEALEEARRVGKGLTPPTSLLRFGTATLAFIVGSLAKELARPTSSSSLDTSPPSPSSPDSTDSSDGSPETTASETSTSSSSSEPSSPTA